MNATANANAWTGRGNLRTLVDELQRQRDSRIDFVADTRQMRLISHTNGSLRLIPQGPQVQEWLPGSGVEISDHALAQIAAASTPEIPTKYIRALAAGNAQVAAQLVNDTIATRRRFVRCLDGKCRAFLSDSYRVMDNFDLAFSALEVAKAVGAEVLECSLSESNMRIKLVTKSIWDRIDERQQNGGGAHEFIGADANGTYRDAIAFAGTGNGLDGGTGTVNPIVTVSNSETGQGGLNVRVGIFRAYCLNTCLTDEGVREIHLGSRMAEGFYSAETRAADTKALSLKCRDAIKAAFSPEGFAKIVAQARGAQAVELTAPSSAVGLLIEGGLLAESRKDALLDYFLGAHDKTAWGLAQGLSRLSQDTTDPGDAEELELLAGKIIASPKMVLA